MRFQLLLVVIGMDCAKTDKAAPPKPEGSAVPVTASADAAPVAPAGLAATSNGKPVTFTSAIATLEGDEVMIELATFPTSCKEKLAGFSSRSSEPSDVDARLRIGPILNANGTLGWAIRGAYTHYQPPGEKASVLSQSEKEDGGDPVAFDAGAAAAANARTEVPIELSIKALEAHGKIAVTGCGAKGKPKDPVAQLGDGTITIAGKALPIGGAAFIVKKDGTRTLQLGTHPVACVDGSDWTSTRSDVAITLTWDKAGTPIDVTRNGAWIDFGQALPKLTATPNKPSGKKLVTTLGGETTSGDYAIALSGKLEAIVCPTPK